MVSSILSSELLKALFKVAQRFITKITINLFNKHIPLLFIGFGFVVV